MITWGFFLLVARFLFLIHVDYPSDAEEEQIMRVGSSDVWASVEKVLHGDPMGVYAGMEFATRDRYRHAIERIASRSHLTEAEVAAKAIELTRASVPETLPQKRYGSWSMDRSRKCMRSRITGNG